MAGQLFTYHGKTFMPSQYCEKAYGGGIVLKEVLIDGGEVSFKAVKKLESPHPTRNIGMHTLNEYKGVVIIDVGGYDFPCFVGRMIKMSKALKKLIRL